jgi:hypothetical protein
MSTTRAGGTVQKGTTLSMRSRPQRTASTNQKRSTLRPLCVQRWIGTRTKSAQEHPGAIPHAGDLWMWVLRFLGGRGKCRNR